jgi:hypothetical protein
MALRLSWRATSPRIKRSISVLRIIVTEVERTRPGQHRRWTAHIADTGEQIVPPDREPEFRACLALYHGLHGERYDGPVKFYRQGEAAPYFLVTSAGAVAQYEAMTPGQMFEMMLQVTSERHRARLIPTNSMAARSRRRIASKRRAPMRPALRRRASQLKG